jgi:hypothetical protein
MRHSSLDAGARPGLEAVGAAMRASVEISRIHCLLGFAG